MPRYSKPNRGGRPKLPTSFTIFTAPWRPKPDLATPEAQALRADLEANGQLQPILVLQNGTVVDGRHRFLLLKELKKQPVIKVVKSAAIGLRADLLKKSMGIVDQALVIRGIEAGEFGDLPKAKVGTKKAARIASFIRVELGWLQWSARKVEQAIQLSRAPMAALVSARGCRSLRAALICAGVKKVTPKVKAKEVPVTPAGPDGQVETPAETTDADDGDDGVGPILLVEDGATSGVVMTDRVESVAGHQDVEIPASALAQGVTDEVALRAIAASIAGGRELTADFRAAMTELRAAYSRRLEVEAHSAA